MPEMRGSSSSFTRIDPNGNDGAGLPHVSHDPTDTPLKGAQHPQAYTAFTDATGQLTAGVWACDAGVLEVRNLPFEELCFVIEGEVEITDDQGTSSKFSEGDAFMLHKGFTGTWRMPRAFRKFNGIFTAKSK